MPPSTLVRCTQRNRFWVVLHDGDVPLPVDAAGAQAARTFTTWHDCCAVVSDVNGVLRRDAVFHAFASLAEAHAYTHAAGRD